MCKLYNVTYGKTSEPFFGDKSIARTNKRRRKCPSFSSCCIITSRLYRPSDICIDDGQNFVFYNKQLRKILKFLFKGKSDERR